MRYSTSANIFIVSNLKVNLGADFDILPQKWILNFATNHFLHQPLVTNGGVSLPGGKLTPARNKALEDAEKAGKICVQAWNLRADWKSDFSNEHPIDDPWATHVNEQKHSPESQDEV